jgi:hypothetical protein
MGPLRREITEILLGPMKPFAERCGCGECSICREVRRHELELETGLIDDD